MSSTLKINDKDIVVPGEILAEGMDYLPGQGMYRSGNNILASRVGLVKVDGKVLKLIPLSGRYLPKKGDVIIGRVKDITLNGWIFDTNSAYQAMLPMNDASTDYIQRGADLTMKGPGLRKLEGGRILKVSPSKVPRIIGKQGSMVSMVKKAANCNIVV